MSNTNFIDPSAPTIPAEYQTNPSKGPTTPPKLSGTPVSSEDGLQYVDIKLGTGTPAANGNKVSVHYTGWLASNGQKFDSSYDGFRGAFELQLGKGQVIKGWDKGLLGLAPGGFRRIYIPASLGYGSRGAGGVIPPNADLIFDVQLIAVK